MSKEQNPAALDYWVFNKDYPLHSNAAILNIGSAGSGKSYFTYKYIIPIYIKYGGIKTILICSRTGRFDATTAGELESPIYKDVSVEFVSNSEVYKKCQVIRAEAIINEFLLDLQKIKKEEDLIKIGKKLTKLIKDTSDLEYLKEELEKLRGVINRFLVISPDDIKDYAEMLYIRGSKLTYNPILLVYDDYSGTDEFIKQYSNIHKLIYVRRHLHLTMLMNVQSLITVSTNIRRNTTIFICFSTLSERDLKLLSDRLPIKWSYKNLLDAFIQISDAENRDDKLLTLFTVYPNNKIICGTPEILKNINTEHGAKNIFKKL